MNRTIVRCAPETLCVAWQFIDWNKVYHSVKLLQQRIVKAIKEGRYNKAKSLQWMLTHSFHAKLLAVKRVTENKGKNTTGIDGVLWNTPLRKLKAAKSLVRKGYKSMPLKRVLIPKKNGKKRALGIPTMYDRAMQALYLMALNPVSETKADACSYGFRPKRGCADAIARCFIHLSKSNSATWILEADIKGCFDHISHSWMLGNILIDKMVLKQWLKAGFIDNKRLFPTKEGTPQGGIISPALANMTLDGLQVAINEALNIRLDKNGNKRNNKHKVHLVRYADDFIVTGDSEEILTNTVLPVIEKFLTNRGLRLSEEKTDIIHINKGFNFLGQHIRKYTNGTLLIKPSKDSCRSVKAKIKLVVNKNKASHPVELIQQLNPIIRGWCNYHRHISANKQFNSLDCYVWNTIWKWAKRRHPNKGGIWIKGKYFKSNSTSNWVFSGKDKKGNEFQLIKANRTKVVRHRLIRGNANPFDPQWDKYFHCRRVIWSARKPRKNSHIRIYR
ncbi:group II intron reverse transcriptase/maturase [Changchengzhania lutea]|uniref:group II intron reverse transcriptase/maturase n=1 Tax=Changchengzhania lutea TaxID=2049305 RepID=UPI00115F46B9|nr:group II intron reverse transcriptase/maturase [Changchengzhania lutea]